MSMYVIVDNLSPTLLSRTTSKTEGDVARTPSGKYILEILDTRDPAWVEFPLFTSDQIQDIVRNDSGSFWGSLWS